MAISISALAARFKLRPSTLRYYEDIGLLPAVTRLRGQRRYDERSIKRLAVIRTAKAAGLSLNEIRELLARFKSDEPTTMRWQPIAERKIAELDQLKERIDRTQSMLRRLQACRCTSAEACGEKLLRHQQRAE